MHEYRSTSPTYKRKAKKTDEAPDEQDTDKEKADVEDADSDQDGTTHKDKGKDKDNNNWQDEETRKWLRRIGNLAVEVHGIEEAYPEDLRVVRKHAEPKLLPDVIKAVAALGRFAERLKQDLSGEEAAAEGAESIRATVARAQGNKNGNDVDTAASAEARKAHYPDADATDTDAVESAETERAEEAV
jgi:hypothetical protein